MKLIKKFNILFIDSLDKHSKSLRKFEVINSIYTTNKYNIPRGSRACKSLNQ